MTGLFTKLYTLNYDVFLSKQWGTVNSLKDCFGIFLAIDPEGFIYPCQRFCGNTDYHLGNIYDMPTLNDIYNNPNAIKIIEREKEVTKRCKECLFYQVCKGGCYYNALAGGDGVIDYLCNAYKNIYKFVQDRLMEELAKEENMNAIAARPPLENEHPLFRSGAYIALSKKRHPKLISSSARTILGLYELAKTNNPITAAKNMVENNYCGNIFETEKVMQHYFELLNGPTEGLNNLYLHLTFKCNLRCSHCYAAAGEDPREVELELLKKLYRESKKVGFRQLIITGGEPLVHSQIDTILNLCNQFRNKKMNLVLRTNLTGKYSNEFIQRVGEAFDQVVVSVDGNEKTHERRRGNGTYHLLLKNIKVYQELSKLNSIMGELSIACVMNSEDINGEPGWSVRKLAAELGVKRTRFRPLLPLGRAEDFDEPLFAEGLLEHLSSKEILESEIKPIKTCGIGQNIYIEPDGNSFPCYAYHRPHTFLGNVTEHELADIINSNSFKALQSCTVNTLKKCSACEYRYLCGGACRAWGNEENQYDLFAAPPNCDHLKKKAKELIEAAHDYIK
jgi:uncharacterized protein